jgi:hypothetical protein
VAILRPSNWWGISCGGAIGETAVTYPTDGAPYIYAFMNSQYTDNLYVNYGSGTTWHWSDLGNPGVKVFSPAPVVVGSDIYVFCGGWDGNLYLKQWNGSSWQWHAQGHPANAVTVTPSPTSAIAFNDGVQYINVFGVSVNGDLCINYWNGSGWYWTDHSHP